MRFHVWIVSQQDKPVWELGGVFTTEELAIAACKLPTDGYWKIELDKEAPRETEWIAGVFPLAVT